MILFEFNQIVKIHYCMIIFKANIIIIKIIIKIIVVTDC